ncbi:MAG: PH domain-containing protein [Provencibacterium sp.]|jgi:uncharacterized membrane protein YdbT with pleckstrin-like domain|nr:PH domain-containing protein [Provencibacterium sp.]
MKEEWRHSHPFLILHNLKGFFYMLIIPLVRGFVTAFGGGLAAWLNSAWVDILVFVFILLGSVWQWRCCTYRFDRRGLHARQGILIRRTYYIPLQKIATLCAVHSFYLRPFGAVNLRADTLAGSKKRNDFSLFVSKSEAQRILQLRLQAVSSSSSLTRQYRPKSLYVAALAAFSSSSFAGVVFLATLVSQTGKLLGNEFSERIYGTFSRVTHLLAFGLPPAAAALGYLLLFGWLCAFTVNFIRHKNFCLRRQGNALYITGGIFTKREYAVAVQSINFLDIRQSVLSWLLRFCSVHIHAVGYSKHSDDVSGVVPAVRTRDVQKTLHLFFPEFIPDKRQLKHNWGALFKFIGDPSWGCILIPVCTLLLRWLLPDWGDFIGWVGFMLCFPAYWFLTVRLIDYFTSGIAREGDRFTLRYSSGYFLHTVVLPRDKIAWVCLRQSPIQYFDKKCDLLVFSFSEGERRHHIRNLDWQAAAELFGLQK